MSDGSAPVGTPEGEQYTSLVDSAFSAAWNSVYSESSGEEAPEDAEEAPAGGSGEEAPAASPEGDDGAGAAAGAQEGGDAPAAPESALPGLPGIPKPEGAGAGGDATPPAAAPVADEGFDPTGLSDLFTSATEQMYERMEGVLRQQAFSEVQQVVDPQFFDIMRLRPTQMVGMEVPSVRPGAAPEERIKLLDSAMARQYQEDIGGMIEDQITDVASRQADSLRPMMSVIQDAIQMLDNNPDLIPGTKGFDPELQKRVIEVGKSYEVRANGKMMGYQVKMQPIINVIRNELAKERGTVGAQKQQQQQAAARSAAAAARAAEQPRRQGGQFDSPQVGITSKTMPSGKEEADYTPFWEATGLNLGGALPL